MKILILTNELLVTCGISKHLLYFLEEVKNRPEYEFIIVCGGGDAIDSYKPLVKEVLVWSCIKHENRSIFNFIKSFFKLLFLQKKNKFDIIHAHHHYSANLAVLVSKLTKVKVIQTNHGIFEPIGLLSHFPANNIIAVNEHIKDYLINELNYQNKNIRLIKNGIVFNHVLKKPKNEKLKIISAGRLIEEKGFDVYIRAISLIPDEIKSKAEFNIAGKGIYESSLLELDSKLKTKINFVGEIKNLVNYFSQTDIFVNASRSKSEGFPIVIAEAALTKNLIISSKFYGYDTLLKDKVNSLLFEVDNINELAKLLEKTITNYENTKPLISKMFDDAKTKFDNKIMLEKIFDLYNNVLK